MVRTGSSLEVSRAAAFAGVLAACGGGAPAGSEVSRDPLLPADGSFASGLPPDRSVASLDRAEQAALCEAAEAAIPPLTGCPSWGMLAAYNLAFDPGYNDGGALASDARLRDACASTRRDCERSLAPGAGTEQCDLGFRVGCTGSVALFERCMNDMLSATRTLLAATPACAELSCSAFPAQAQQWLDDGHAFSASLASCTELYATCPASDGATSLAPSPAPMVAASALECAD